MKLKLSRNKISIIAIILLLGISVPVCTYAAGTGRKNNLKSEGIIDYTNGTQSVCIDSRDLYYLADEIDTVEETAKLGTIQAIQALPDVASATGLSGKTVADINDITFAQLNEAIKISQASSSSPSAPEILSGKVAWANGKKYIGTMPNNGAVGKANLTAGSSYTIPIGYTTGGTVTAATLASQTKGTATAANLSQGVTAWVNGVMLTGTGKDNNSYYTQGKNQGYSEGYDKGLEDGANQMEIKTGSYTWTFGGNKYDQGGRYLNINGPDNSLFYDTGKSNLIASAITGAENLYFYSYDDTNKNHFAPGQVTTSISSGKVYINVPAGMRITNYYGTGENDYGTTTITVTYYYY